MEKGAQEQNQIQRELQKLQKERMEQDREIQLTKQKLEGLQKIIDKQEENNLRMKGL